MGESAHISLCFATKSSPGRKQNGAGSLAKHGHESWECAHTTGRGPLTEEGKDLLQTSRQTELRFGQIVCKSGKPKPCWSCSMNQAWFLPRLSLAGACPHGSSAQAGVNSSSLPGHLYQMNILHISYEYIIYEYTYTKRIGFLLLQLISAL